MLSICPLVPAEVRMHKLLPTLARAIVETVPTGIPMASANAALDRTLNSPEPEYADLTLEGMGALGDCIAHLDGQQVNVFGGIPGEVVRCRIVRYRRRRQRRVSAIVEQVLEPSPSRVTPSCPYFGPCSGCQWQHVDYARQLEIKRNAVQRELDACDALRGLCASPTLPADQRYWYRNHARFTVRRPGVLGFVNRITRRFVRIDRCMLMAPWINETLQKLQDRSGETTQLSVRYGVNTGDWLIQPKLKNPDVPLESGQTHYRESVEGREFRVASPSFFQVNTAQAERLVALVRDRAALTGAETLVDAYTGVGTFGVLLAPHVRRVIAIEESEAAVRDASGNAHGISNFEVRQGRTEDVLASMAERPDVVILDPPRVGCRPEALEALLRMRPDLTVYVSCDPAALARDLNVLVEGRFSVESVEPVDMFPQTHHVECVATLSGGGA